MKNPFLATAACLLMAVSACKKDLRIPLPSSEGTTGFKTYVIPKGAHYATENPLKAIELSSLHFRVKFDSSAVYQTLDPENQYDINKLYGFSDNGAGHQQFSARFGWRWSEGALRLFAYTYNNGVRDSKELGEVPIGKEVDCAITVTGEAYLFTLNGKTESLPRKSTTAKAKGYQLYPYFGGDEAAPHEVRIAIREVEGE